MKSTVNRIALALMLGCVVTVTAQAQFSWQSFTDPLVPGHIINDLFVDFAGEVPIVEMLLDAPGSIYQNDFGDAAGGPPGESIVGLVPEALYDTFVTLGSETSPIPGTQLLIAGGAVDIGGASGATMSPDLIDMTWSPAGGQTFPNSNPGSGMFMARVTLVDTLDGEATLYLQDANGPSGAIAFPIIGGALVPEPSSMAMLALGLLALLRRRV